jgi:hypothetical protein
VLALNCRIAATSDPNILYLADTLDFRREFAVQLFQTNSIIWNESELTTLLIFYDTKSCEAFISGNLPTVYVGSQGQDQGDFGGEQLLLFWQPASSVFQKC